MRGCCWVGCGVRRRLASGTLVDWTWVSSEGSSGALGSSCSGRYRLREVAPSALSGCNAPEPLEPLEPHWARRRHGGSTRPPPLASRVTPALSLCSY
jgi:hypothetical protein